MKLDSCKASPGENGTPACELYTNNVRQSSVGAYPIITPDIWQLIQPQRENKHLKEIATWRKVCVHDPRNEFYLRCSFLFDHKCFEILLSFHFEKLLPEISATRRLESRMSPATPDPVYILKAFCVRDEQTLKTFPTPAHTHTNEKERESTITPYLM